MGNPLDQYANTFAHSSTSLHGRNISIQHFLWNAQCLGEICLTHEKRKSDKKLGNVGKIVIVVTLT